MTTNPSICTIKPKLRRSNVLGGGYPADTTPILLGLRREYERRQEPVQVSFRKLVPWLKVGERATHYLHSYPAKLLPHIAHFFLAADGLATEKETVLDPFGGTGTVALEALLSGKDAFYADVNPLARLIAAAKTKPVNVSHLEALLVELKLVFDSTAEAPIPWVVNINLWYSARVQQTLARLRYAIGIVSEPVHSDFLWATFSATARKCSRADMRFSVPVRTRGNSQDADLSEEEVWLRFKAHFDANLQRHREFQALLLNKKASARCVGEDARCLLKPPVDGKLGALPLPDESVGLILTSPPYAGAQKYIRASSLSLGWLGATERGTLKALENASIGREHFRKSSLEEIPETQIVAADRLISEIAGENPLRAAICANYLREMGDAVAEMARVLKPNGKAVIVIGDNTVCGRPFMSSVYLIELFKQSGLDVTLRLTDSIKSRSLVTKRNGGVTAIQSETVLVLEK